MFLASFADIAIYGGGAGGGKSFALLLEAIRNKDVKDYGAVIFRRETTQIRAKGGLWDESTKLYTQLGGVPRETQLDWTFRSGATVKFAHLEYEKDKFKYQGAQIPLIGFDELTHFTEGQFWYLLTRNRSTCGVPPYIRATTNPDADSWVAKLIEWWIDEKTGLPIPERAGVLRWFVRVNEVLEWADDPEGLRDRFPQSVPKSLTFIPAKLSDNKILMAADPGYLANLLAQPLVERERLLGGNWKVKPAAGKIFNRTWFNSLPSAPPTGGVCCLFVDFAATEKQLGSDDPDFSAACLMQKPGDGRFIIHFVDAVQAGPAEGEKWFVRVLRRAQEIAKSLGCRLVIRWEIEPGSAGKRENARMIQACAGLDAKGVGTQGQSKLVRSRGLAVQAEAGNVWLVPGPWVEGFVTEMHGMPDSPHDDKHDAAAGAFNGLTTGVQFGAI